MKRVAFFVLAALGVVVACSSDDDADPPDDKGSCATLASQCHPYASTSALGNECHELGHAGDDAKCGPRLAQCQAECPLTDAGNAHLPFEIVDGQVVRKDSGPTTTTDASGEDANTSSTPPECIPYCDCLESTCKTQTGYPFATKDDCLKACPLLTTDERTCWAAHCEHAKTLSVENRSHSCSHGYGGEGLEECPYGQ